MKNHKSLFTVIAMMSLAGTTLFLSTALAGPYDKSSKPAAAMEAPQPPLEIKTFTDHAGTYEGMGTLTMGDKVAHYKMTHINKVISDGFGLQCTEENMSKEMGSYKSVDLFGFDPGKQMVHMFTVSNMAEIHDHFGKWTDGKTLALEYDGMKEGKAFVETVNIVFDSPTQYHFTSESTVDGQPESTFKGSMTKMK
jgi:hypothetical protein